MSQRGSGNFSRGRGRGRGGGGRGGSSRQFQSHGGGGRGGGGGGRGRPPPHLKGKEIGLWHRDNAIRKRLEVMQHIELSSARRAKISSLLELLEERSSTTPASESDFLRRYKQNLFDNVAAADSSTLMNSLSLMERNSDVDVQLRDEFEHKQASPRYQNLLKFRTKLPAFQHRDEFLKLVNENQIIVVSGETGCGKTTQCCQLILDEMITKGNGSMCNIVCTQPRRISAISVAERVADERDEGVGKKSVGYSIRLESRIPTRTNGTILFCTTGVIFQYLKEDPTLCRFSHIVVDEIHERDVLSDFLIAILKDLMRFRPDLKIILMSATLNAEHFSRYFGNCPCFNIPGFTFPVQEFYLEDALEMTHFTFESNSRRENTIQPFQKGRRYNKWGQNNDEETEFERMLEVHIRKLEREKLYNRHVLNELKKPEAEELNLDLIEALLKHICESDKDNGAVLIFVPGWDQISKLHSQLQSGYFTPTKYLIIPLHSLMPTVNQKEVFHRPTGGRRKIIIATNIAETSITIDDIVFVIDAGKIKMTNFDLQRNIETLDTEWVSLANATQRKGRAGRVQEGVCFHLFTKARHMTLDRFKKPEVLRKRLEEVVLQIKVLKLGMAAPFLRRLLDPPSPAAIDLAVKRLIQLQALDDDENLTPLGFHLAHLPMDPQTGKMILMGAIFGCVDPILSVAASLSFKDGFYIPLGQERQVDRIRNDLAQGTKSDHMVNVFAMEGYEKACRANRERDYCYRHFLSGNTMQLLSNMKKQFAQYLHDMKFTTSLNYKDPSNNINSENIGLVLAVICAGLYPNIATVRVKRGRDGSYQYPLTRTPEDGRVTIHPKSVNCKERRFESPYLAYFQKMKSTSLFLYDTSMVSPFPLIFFGGKLSFGKQGKHRLITIDNNIEFHIEKPVFELIQSLRKHLDKLLIDKISNPGPTCWSELARDGAILRAIIQLITAEYNDIVGEPSISDSDSEDD